MRAQLARRARRASPCRQGKLMQRLTRWHVRALQCGVLGEGESAAADDILAEVAFGPCIWSCIFARTASVSRPAAVVTFALR